jgi:hypothetical protein
MHYITAKDQILLRAAEYSTLFVRGRMERAERDHRGLEALRQVVYTGLPASAEMIGHWKVWFGFWELSASSDTIRRVLHDRYDESARRYGRLIRNAQKCGEAAPDIPVADAAASLNCQLDGIGVYVLISGRKMSPARQRAQIDRWIDRMLVGEKARIG